MASSSTLSKLIVAGILAFVILTLNHGNRYILPYATDALYAAVDQQELTSTERHLLVDQSENSADLARSVAATVAMTRHSDDEAAEDSNNDDEGRHSSSNGHPHLRSRSSNKEHQQQSTMMMETAQKVSTAKNMDAQDSELLTMHQQQQQQQQRNISLVVQLTGEAANNLLHIAHAVALQHHNKANNNSDINLQLVLRHQESYKWKNARTNLQTCFPTLRSLQFDAANGNEYNQRKLEQEKMATATTAALVELPVVVQKSDSNLELLQQYLADEKIYETNNNHNISLPYLFDDQMASWVDRDEYYEELQSFFKFDHQACCKLVADPDESVFHYRNFLAEMKRLGKRSGLEELSPSKVANEVFGHLTAGDKVAITTRFGARRFTQPYVVALEEKGLQVRVITNQTSMEDYCFLQSAQKELVGSVRSTFLVWAGLFGQAERVRYYSVDSVHTQKRSALKGRPVFRQHDFKNPELKRRIQFELYVA